MVRPVTFPARMPQVAGSKAIEGSAPHLGQGESGSSPGSVSLKYSLPLNNECCEHLGMEQYIVIIEYFTLLTFAPKLALH